MSQVDGPTTVDNLPINHIYTFICTTHLFGTRNFKSTVPGICSCSSRRHIWKIGNVHWCRTSTYPLCQGSWSPTRR